MMNSKKEILFFETNKYILLGSIYRLNYAFILNIYQIAIRIGPVINKDDHLAEMFETESGVC